MSIHYVLAHPNEESLTWRDPKCITEWKKDETEKEQDCDHVYRVMYTSHVLFVQIALLKDIFSEI